MLGKDDFTSPIRIRGLEYYKKNMIEKITYAHNIYYAKINGYDVFIDSGTSSSERERFVKVNDIDNMASSGCTCPCNFNCKHLYTLVLKIKEIKEIEKKLQNMGNDELLEIIKRMYYLNMHNSNVITVHMKLHDLSVYYSKPYYPAICAIAESIDKLMTIDPKQLDSDDIEQVGKIYANIERNCVTVRRKLKIAQCKVGDEKDLVENLHIYGKILERYAMDEEVFDRILELLE